MSTITDVHYETGKYQVETIDRELLGQLLIGSEPGRTIVVTHGGSRLFLDARDIPQLTSALNRAAHNANQPVTCPNGCTETRSCSDCP
jgi:hypothetical protein